MVFKDFHFDCKIQNGSTFLAIFDSFQIDSFLQCVMCKVCEISLFTSGCIDQTTEAFDIVSIIKTSWIKSTSIL